MITVSDNFKAAVKGAIDISKVKVLVNFQGTTWTDISAWVLPGMNGRAEEVDSMDGGTSPNWANLTLINDDGRFSPPNTAGPYYGYLTPNKPIVIYVTVPGEPDLPIFTGITGNWLPSARSRICSLKCYDEAMLLVGHEIVSELVYNAATPASGRTWNWVFERAAWLAGVRWDWVTTRNNAFASTSQLNADGSSTTITVASDSALTTAIYRQGGSGGVIAMRIDIVRSAVGAALILPATWLEGSGLRVLADLAQVIDGRLWFDAMGAMRLRSRMYVGDSATPVETLTVSNFDDVSYSQNYEAGSLHVDIVNKVTITANPLGFKFDATGNLASELVTWAKDKLPAKMQDIAPSATFPDTTDPAAYIEMPASIRILKNSQPFPSANNAMIYAYSDGGNDASAVNFLLGFSSGYPKFDWDRVQLSIQSNFASTCHLSHVDLYALLATPSGSQITAIQIDQNSIDAFGTREKSIANDAIPDALAAQNLVLWLIASRKGVKDLFTLPLMHALPWVELGDTIQFSETITNTQPISSNGIPRAYNWQIGMDSFTQTFEVTPPAPANTLSTAIGGITEISTTHIQGMKGDSIPYPALAGVGKQVGLSNIPAFTSLTTATRKLNNTTVGAYAFSGVAFYGGFIWTVSANGYVSKIDPLTMTTVGTWQISGAQFFDCKAYANYLYIADSQGNQGRVIWFDMSNPGVTQGTNYDVKINLYTLTTNPGCYPRFMTISGTKLYVHARSTAATGSRPAIIYQVEIGGSGTPATVTAPDCSDTTTPAYYDVLPQEIIAANGRVWCAACNRPSGDAITVATTANATQITVASVADLSIGMPIKVGIDMGLNSTDDFTYITGAAGNTLTVSPALLSPHPTTDKVFGLKSTITPFNPTTGHSETASLVNDGPLIQGLEWDGSRYIWASFTDKAARYSLVNTTLIFDKGVGVSGKSPGCLQFDGTYLWWVRAGSVNQIEPRSGVILGMFSTDSIYSGASAFDGRSVLIGSQDSSYASIYQVPRWTSGVI